MQYGLISGGVVRQTMTASYEPASPWVVVPDAVQAGWLFDGTDYSAPPSPPATLRTRLSKREFRNQFTSAEKQAIYTAAETSVDVRIFLDDLMAVDFVDLDFSDTIASVNALESAGLIAAGRAAAILEGVSDGV